MTPLLSDSFIFVSIGDLEKSFLQISLSPQDRDFIRFIWLKDTANVDFENFENNAFVEYRICKILYGLSCSPFSLTATLQRHLNQFSVIDPEFVEKVLRSLHVVDFISGTETIEEAKVLFEKTKTRLAEEGFNLRKFKSNCLN